MSEALLTVDQVAARLAVHPATAPFQAWARITMCDARKRAKGKRLRCSITAEWVRAKLVEQDYKCAVSGIAFSEDKPKGAHKRPWMPSLDRIDCREGYTKANVRIVCVAVNTLLQDWGDGIFVALIEAYGKR